MCESAATRGGQESALLTFGIFKTLMNENQGPAVVLIFLSLIISWVLFHLFKRHL